MKAQQDASRELINYVYTSKPQHFENYKTQLQIPINDSLARVSLDKNRNHNIARKHFLLGKIIPEDIENIIWVYKNFKPFSQLKKQ